MDGKEKDRHKSCKPMKRKGLVYVSSRVKKDNKNVWNCNLVQSKSNQNIQTHKLNEC